MSGKNGGATPSVYVSSPSGFTDAGLLYYDQALLPALRHAGFHVLDPWHTEDGVLTEAKLAEAADTGDQVSYNANLQIALRNEESLTKADIVLGLLDGPDIDSGVAGEIGFAAAIEKPIVGLRTDRRNSGDNPGTTINLQVLYLILRNNGQYVRTIDEACAALHACLP